MRNVWVFVDLTNCFIRRGTVLIWFGRGCCPKYMATRPTEADVHTTTRQRLRAARRAEGAARYEAMVVPTLHLGAVSRPRTASYGAKPVAVAINSHRQPINHCGQVLEGDRPAISRLVGGEFYGKPGNAVGEIVTHAEGKGFRCRAAAPPDVTLRVDPFSGLDAKPTPGSCGLHVKPLVDLLCDDKPHVHSPISHSHRGDRKKHHCHHGHRRVAGAPGHLSPTESMHSPRFERVSHGPPFMADTFSSSTKKAAVPVPPEEKQCLAAPQRQKPSASAYETALQHVAAEPPGTAACISADELQRYKAIVSPIAPEKSKRVAVVSARRAPFRRADAETLFH